MYMFWFQRLSRICYLHKHAIIQEILQKSCKMLSSLHFNTLADPSLRAADRIFIMLNGNQLAVLSIYKFKTCQLMTKQEIELLTLHRISRK